MITDVLVWSYNDLIVASATQNGLEPPDDSVYISVLCPDEKNMVFPEERDDALPLYFWDLDPTNLTYNREKFLPGCMNEDQAKQIVAFIKKWNDDPKPVKLRVNCVAGISRSGAIGVFATDFLRKDYQEFARKHYWIRPNAHVSALLWRAARGLLDG